jgi:hypothetical protein
MFTQFGAWSGYFIGFTRPQMLNQENPGMSRLLLPLEIQALSEATYGSHMAPMI